MGWESRKRGRFFYRSSRQNGRVVKTYIGRGIAGRAAADFLAEARQRRLDQAAAFRTEQARLASPTQALADLDAACSLMIEAILTIAGFHKVDSKWRKKRVPRS
jgi:predicted component of type VI protein secretion system